MMVIWWIVLVVWLTDERWLALFPVGTIVQDPHHRESLTHCEQCLNLHSGLVEWSCVVVITTTPRCHVDLKVDLIFFFLFTILIKGYFTWFILTKLKLNVHCQGLLILLDFNWRLYWVQVLVKMDQSLWLFVLYCLATSGTKYVIQTCDEHVSIAKQWLAVL